MGQNGIVKRFRGSYDVKIDDRGRVKIPSRFLTAFDSVFGREVFITSVDGENVLIYPIKIWETMEEKFENVGSFTPDIDEFVDHLSFWGTESEIDSRGRILISPELRESSALNGTVRVFGKSNHLVIWNQEAFSKNILSEKFSKERLHKVSRILNETNTLSGNVPGDS